MDEKECILSVNNFENKLDNQIDKDLLNLNVYTCKKFKRNQPNVLCNKQFTNPISLEKHILSCHLATYKYKCEFKGCEK